MDRYFGSASGSSPDPLTRTRSRLTASPPSAFLVPAFNACAYATSDVDPALLRLSRQSSAAACRFLRSSPLSPIVNVNPVAIEEEVLVMDEVFVSESRKANYMRRNNSAGGVCKMELCRSWEEVGVCRYGSKCQFAHGKEELLWELRGARPCKQKSERFGYKGNKYVPSAGSISYKKKSYLPGPNTPRPSLASTPVEITPAKVLPSTVKPPSSTFNWPPTEEEDDLIMHVLYGPTTRLRLPVFEQMCPQ